MSDGFPTPLPATYWVLPGELLAGEHPAETEQELTERRLGALVASGIRTFVDLTEQGETGPGYQGVLRQASERESVQTTYVNIPIRDMGVPSPWTLRCILDVIDRSIADENPVLVHCLAGLGRTGLVVGCYLKRHGMADDDDVIQELAYLRKNGSDLWGTSPQTEEQVRMVTAWKLGK